jgi:tRNA A37 methylthiotransferase MiaB
MSSPLKVMLINPPPIAIVEPWFDAPEWPRDSLAYVAGYLRQFDGYDVQIIDAKFQRLNFQQVKEMVDRFQPDVVGLCALTNEIKPAAYQASLIKDVVPNCVAVIGGPHVTAIPEPTLREFPMFDVGVIGEGEITFHLLCQAIRDGGDFRDIEAICFRREEGVVVNPKRDRVLEQDSLPDPAFDLLPSAKEYWVQTVRGCPFNCHFCMNHNGRVARKRDVDRVIAQIENLIDKHGAKHIRFGDEIFTIDMERTHMLLDEMMARGIHKKITWDCQTHVRFVDLAITKKMKAANCLRVDMGIETGDDEKLRVLGKGTTIKMIEEAFEAARQADLPFGTLLIIGHPNETKESIKRTLDLAVRFNPDTPFISVMTPFPGTEVSRMAAAGENGYTLTSTDWDDFSKMSGGVLEFAGLTRSQIAWWQLWGYVRVFLFNWRFVELAKFIWTYRGAGMTLVKRGLFGQQRHAGSRLVPPDYHERLASDARTTAEDIIRGRISWEEYQKLEMQRTRKVASNLLRVVTAR